MKIGIKTETWAKDHDWRDRWVNLWWIIFLICGMNGLAIAFSSPNDATIIVAVIDFFIMGLVYVIDISYVRAQRKGVIKKGVPQDTHG